MKRDFIKISLIALLLAIMVTGCKKEKLTDETRKARDYIGKYSGYVIRERMAPDGYVAYKNAFVEKVLTEVEITQSEQGDNFLMVYVSAYNDSILCEFDESTGYIWIRDRPYSFYMRKNDFSEFKGNYDMAVSTYGRLGNWQQTDTITFGIGFLKDMNDSIYKCSTKTKKYKL